MYLQLKIDFVIFLVMSTKVKSWKNKFKKKFFFKFVKIETF